MKPLRILLVTETYPPEINGVAMTTEHLVEGLRARGHWVGIVRPKQKFDPPQENTWTVFGLPIPKYPGLRIGVPAVWRLRKLIDQLHPDLVHIVTEGPLGWAGANAARSRHLPVTSGYHTHFDQYSKHYGFRWMMPFITGWLDSMHRNCQATIAPTPDLANALRARGIPNVHVVGRGVDTHLFHPSRRDGAMRQHWGLAEDDLACLYVGRLAPEKNLEIVERAFSAIAGQNSRAKMIWVGDGPALAHLKTMHPQHIFAGPRVGEDLAKHYASADLFLFGSLSETWGNVLTEALASGLGVTTYRRAAAEILIRDRVNGRSITSDDETAFISAATELAGNRDLRTALGAEASKSITTHAWSSIIERFETVLREAISK